MSIAQGGSGFPFLAPAVYEYISIGKITNVEVDVHSMSDGFLKFAITKVTVAVIALATLRAILFLHICIHHNTHTHTHTQ